MSAPAGPARTDVASYPRLHAILSRVYLPKLGNFGVGDMGGELRSGEGTGLSGPEAADEDAFPLTTPARGRREQCGKRIVGGFTG